MRGSIPVGPFELQKPIGRGAMAEVWAGVHVAQDVPVAVKVLHGDRALSPAYVAEFRREAERLAALDHPAIVTIFDHGVLSRETGLASAGMLSAGCPYLVMELCEAGSLARRGPFEWPDVVSIVRVLLDALAHAHARGVIHRDLKPGNVLVTTDPTRPSVLLTDFGIAHALVDLEEPSEDDEASAVGTPGYMAPEQVLGEIRDFGPWTDLYALGCLTWALLVGRAPFRTGSSTRTLLAHVSQDLPELPANVVVPDGAFPWLQKLAARDPRARWRRAADAAAALESIAGRVDAPLRLRLPDPASAPILDDLRARAATLTTPRSTMLSATSLSGAQTSVDEGPTEAFSLSMLAPQPPVARVRPTERERLPSDVFDLELPPLPAWRAGDVAPPRMQLVGAGLSLYGARELPIADRERERDQIWRALATARAERRTQIVLLRGASGVGKSRILRWVLHRTHELGVATTMLATHGPERGPRDGLGAALARHLGCVGLPPELLRTRLGTLITAAGDTGDPLEVDALFALLAPFACPGGAPPGLARDASTHALRRALVREARERTLVIGVDDLQWGDETVRTLETLRAQGGPPMLVVATVQDEAAMVAPETRAQLEALERAEGATVISVGALGPGDHLALVEHLLRLEPSLARELVRRTAGNPLFAEQLVGDWVRRGLLEVRPTGFALREGVSIELPDDLHAVWIARVERLLADRPPRDRDALELAAVLGHRVSESEWERACAIAALGSPSSLADALVRARLVDRDRDGTLAFVHGMLRESVLRASRDTGRHRVHAGVVEMLLRERLAQGAPDALERLGRVLVETRRGREAAPLLARAAEAHRVACEYGTALALLDESDAAFDAAGVPAEDVARAPGWLTRAWVLRLLGHYDATLALAERVLAHRDEPGWRDLAPVALLRRADVEARFGQAEEALADLDAAEAGMMARGDLMGAGHSQWLRAWIYVFAGDTTRALEIFEVLRQASSRPGVPPPGSLHTDWSMGFAHLTRGELDDAEAAYARSDTGAHRLRNRLGLAHGRAGRAVLALLRDDPARAVDLAREALALYRSLGSHETYFAELPLGIGWRRLGRLDDAARVLGTAESALRASGRASLGSRLESALAVVEGERGDWSSVQARLVRIARVIRTYALREALLAQELEALLQMAQAAGHTAVTREVRGLVEHHRGYARGAPLRLPPKSSPPRSSPPKSSPPRSR